MTVNVKPENVKSEIIVSVDHDTWILKITKEGFVFNREKYPLSQPSDFAEAFLKILEKEYTVTFEKREKEPDAICEDELDAAQ